MPAHVLEAGTKALSCRAAKDLYKTKHSREAAFLVVAGIQQFQASIFFLRYPSMKRTWTALVCALVLALGVIAAAQDNGNSNDQNRPVLTPRPSGNTPPAQQSPGASQPPYGSNQTYGAPPNAIPEGSRFIIKLKDTLDTRKMDYTQGKHFKAELREDLVTPSGQLIPKGRTVKGHVASFERGFSGARLLLALDEIETRHGWVPLIGRVTGVPGDPSIKSTENEGEIARKGPDKKRVITSAAIGAGPSQRSDNHVRLKLSEPRPGAYCA